MKLGDPVHPELPWVRKVHDLDEARCIRSAGRRLDAVRRAAERLGDELREAPKVVAVRTVPITDLIYPTKYAFQTALKLPFPYVTMRHRCLLVQVEAEGALHNVLFNPTDRETSRNTPFFKHILDRFGWAEDLFGQPFGTVEDGLRELGVAPEEIDLIAFDHFHTQDLRPSLGTTRGDGIRPAMRARFPNAKLLAPRDEWEDWDRLHPMQRAWFIEDGKKDVVMDRVVLTENDLWLGDGCLLLRTPGHTSGNQTIFVNAEDGVFGCSENGTSADNWSPYESRLPGLRSFVRAYDLEVVLNSNTPELGAEQYVSMVLERSVVDRVPDDPAFVQMFPSSEVTPSPVAPGVVPSMRFEHRTSGTLRSKRASTPDVATAAE
ncbi:MAG TPA: hypothetical protein RMH99_19115 [Sandaracinaceae bacterium LLY-WYZ-13_1]|nr:hypothetical protein [Sandaracinaceae bacterium LLY-WYZ-13_1]